tara:strand:+ start:32 stop:550 length:519 start_codon:yes stop_codon:yes gene_type:complete
MIPIKLWMKTTELINSQYIDGKFNRMDLVVRYMYIKEYVEKNNEFDATNIYLQMLHKWRHLGNEHIKRTGERYISDFNVLIESFKLNGFNEEFPILVNESNSLWNGSHRLAISFCLGIENVFIKKMASLWEPTWGFDWFEKNNFSSSHLDQINSCFKKYFKVYEKSFSYVSK